MNRRISVVLLATLLIGFTFLALGQSQPNSRFGDYGDAPDGQGAGYIHVLPGLIGQFPSLRGLESDNGSWIFHELNSESPLLGESVSGEPNARVVNLDEDDGWRFESLETCSFATLRIEVTVPESSLSDEIYFNGLFDWNHDGRWRGYSACSGSLGDRTVSEWALRNIPLHDEPFNVSAGFQGIVELPTVLTGPHGGELWIRFTLTNEKIDESVFFPAAFGGEGWDGRGLFESGETEDYLSCLLFNRDVLFPGCPAKATLQPPFEGSADADRPPVAIDDSASTFANASVQIDVLSNDSDPDAEPLTLKSVSQPRHGRVEITPDGKVLYFPDANFTGVDEFTYLVCDPLGLCSVGVVKISVQRANQPPIATDDLATTPAGASITLAPLINDRDPEGGTLTLFRVEPPLNGTISLNIDGSVLYTPNANFVGTETINYVVCDSSNACSTGRLIVTVTDSPVENLPPVAENDDAITPEDTPVIIDVMGNDGDPENQLNFASLAIIDPPIFGQIQINPLTNRVIYTPDANFNGQDSFTYQICDLHSLCATALVLITVTAVNDPPTALDIISTVAEDSSIQILLVCTDPESDPLNFHIISPPTSGMISGTAPDLIYTPNGNFNGTDSFTYACDDGSETGNTATVTIAVLPVNDPPVAQINGPYSCTQGEMLQLSSAGSTDNDGQIVSYAWDLNNNGSFETIQENPIFDCSTTGVFTIWLLVTDNEGAISLATTTVTVAAVDGNSPPTAQTLLVSTLQNQPASGNLNVFDPDGDPLTCSLQANALHGSVIVNPDCTFTYTPNSGFFGHDEFTFTVSDQMATASGLVLIEVAAPPAQVAISKIVSGGGGPLGLFFEGDTIAYTITIQNTGLGDAFGVTVFDLLPTTLTFATASDPNYNNGSGVWNVGFLAAGASRTLTITATIKENIYPATIANTASIASCSNAGNTTCTLSPGTASVSTPVSGFCGKSASWSLNWDPPGNRSFSGNTVQLIFDMSNSGQSFIRNGLVTITCLSGDCSKIQSVSATRINAPLNIGVTTATTGNLVNFVLGNQPASQTMTYLIAITLDPSWQQLRLQGTIVNNSCKPADNGQKHNSGTMSHN